MGEGNPEEEGSMMSSLVMGRKTFDVQVGGEPVVAVSVELRNNPIQVWIGLDADGAKSSATFESHEHWAAVSDWLLSNEVADELGGLSESEAMAIYECLAKAIWQDNGFPFPGENDTLLPNSNTSRIKSGLSVSTPLSNFSVQGTVGAGVAGTGNVDMDTDADAEMDDEDNATPVRMSHFTALRHAVAICVQADIPFLLWSGPGMGKTSFVYQLCRLLDLLCITKIGAIHQPEDFSGFPMRNEEDGVADLLPLRYVLDLKKPNSFFFADELSTAPHPVQAAMLRVILERVMGEVPLQCRIGAAANPPNSAVGGMETAAPLNNRFCHISWQVTAQDRAEGRKSGWAYAPPRLPANWEQAIESTETLIDQFLLQRPSLSHAEPPEGQFTPAWPSPRTWEFAARFVAACSTSINHEDVMVIGLEGCIGAAATHEFLAWVRTQRHVDVDKLLSDIPAFLPPLKTEDPDIIEAHLEAVAIRILSGNVDERVAQKIVTIGLAAALPVHSIETFISRLEGKISQARYLSLQHNVIRHQEKLAKDQANEAKWSGTGAGWGGGQGQTSKSAKKPKAKWIKDGWSANGAWTKDPS